MRGVGAGLANGVLAITVLAATAAPSAGAVRASVEAGAAWQSRNDFRIPGEGGSLVRLADFETGAVLAWRGTLTWDLSERQSLRLLAAPLRTGATVSSAQPISFEGRVFAAGRPSEARYVFDSYRATWSYRVAPARDWTLRLGATLKLRSAEISLADEAGRAVKDDLGLVPLLYLFARYRASDRLALELEADAAVAPQGRAEDVSLKAVFRLSDRVDLDLGYRLLEGGADNDAVFTFATFHYAVAGVRVRF